MSEKVQEQQDLAAANAKLAEELKLRELELNARGRQDWERNDSFFKELETKRHKLEKREQEVEDWALSVANRQREVDEIVANFATREQAIAFGEADLRDRQKVFEKQQLAAKKELDDREAQSINDLDAYKKSLEIVAADTARLGAEVIDKEKKVAELKLELERKLRDFDQFRARF